MMLLNHTIHQSEMSLAENEIIKRLILDQVAPNDRLRVLDLGCGTGLIPELLGHRISQYWGENISEEMIKIAQSKFPDVQRYKFSTGDINNSAYLQDQGGEPVDMVISTFGSASYLYDLGQTLGKIYRKLGKNGIGFLMFYSRFSVTNLLNANGGLRSPSLRKKRPYLFRNDDRVDDITVSKGYFHSSQELISIAKKTQFSTHRIMGLNFLLEKDALVESFSKEECIAILQQEMSEIGIPDLGHSLILILNK